VTSWIQRQGDVDTEDNDATEATTAACHCRQAHGDVKYKILYVVKIRLANFYKW